MSACTQLEKGTVIGCETTIKHIMPKLNRKLIFLMLNHTPRTFKPTVTLAFSHTQNLKR
ncbi:hypothetical protein VIBNISO65_130018 [Vibrio nigripulchritudo SO65]|nr:hypothetical protein VIBNIAM115_1940018 [Vibrio nigripulchritudo AM115]CCN41175.1 hypothetical protein VIBNIFTn2_1490008 [Vibrio nigripulchritudo FTn2]CCN68217.1 hypothetical protein VIBNIPon4_980018 [Vibrio nigripulchritudo POn4]CCN75206.1 hypothetical protein VIBNISO65_130018 [Vibrio nigripulchritudo SO65]